MSQERDVPVEAGVKQRLSRKDLLGIRDLAPDEILLLLDVAAQMKEALDGRRPLPSLQGKSLVTIFYEASTRTRVSFERAARALGMGVTNLAVQVSSVAKGESLKDTALTLEALGFDAIVVRHSTSGAPHFIARYVSASVINAGDGMHEHPTQALLDLFTMREIKGRVEGLRVAILGDVLHSRVARSAIWGLTKLGAEVVVCGPPTMMPVHIEEMGARIARRWEEAVEGADVVYLLRIQLERQQAGLLPSLTEYAQLYGMNLEKLKLAKPDALVMHPGPINRGIEISPDLADSDRAVILPQVTNGVAVRTALLWLLLGGEQR